MDSSKLKFSEELGVKVQRLLSSEDIDSLAEKELVPHYRLLNPLTNKIKYMYHNSEIMDFIDKHLLANIKQVKPKTILSFGSSGFSLVEDSFTPKELRPLQNDIYEVDPGLINAPSGIYFLYEKEELVYIGQSVNVIQRGFTHTSENKKVFSKQYFIKIPKNCLLETENVLINYFKPKYNKIYTKKSLDIKKLEDAKHLLLKQ